MANGKCHWNVFRFYFFYFFILSLVQVPNSIFQSNTYQIELNRNKDFVTLHVHCWYVFHFFRFQIASVEYSLHYVSLWITSCEFTIYINYDKLPKERKKTEAKERIKYELRCDHSARRLSEWPIMCHTTIAHIISIKTNKNASNDVNDLVHMYITTVNWWFSFYLFFGFIFWHCCAAYMSLTTDSQSVQYLWQHITICAHLTWNHFLNWARSWRVLLI